MAEDNTGDKRAGEQETCPWMFIDPWPNTDMARKLQDKLIGGEAVLMPSNSHDEVWPGIYVSDVHAARDPWMLQRNGFTHVVNCCWGTGFGRFQRAPEDYEQHGLKLHSVSVADSPKSDLLCHFDQTSDFIHACLSDKGKVVVHCMEGFSRSPTVAAAYLMKHHGMTTIEAVEHIRTKREVLPNLGFINQLLGWERSLHERWQQRREGDGDGEKTQEAVKEEPRAA